MFLSVHLSFLLFLGFALSPLVFLSAFDIFAFAAWAIHAKPEAIHPSIYLRAICTQKQPCEQDRVSAFLLSSGNTSFHHFWVRIILDTAKKRTKSTRSREEGSRFQHETRKSLRAPHLFSRLAAHAGSSVNARVLAEKTSAQMVTADTGDTWWLCIPPVRKDKVGSNNEETRNAMHSDHLATDDKSWRLKRHTTSQAAAAWTAQKTHRRPLPTTV